MTSHHQHCVPTLLTSWPPSRKSVPPNSHSAGRSAASSCPPAGSGSLRLRASWGGGGGVAGLPSRQQSWQGATVAAFLSWAATQQHHKLDPLLLPPLFLRSGSRRAHKPTHVARVLSPLLLHTALLTAGRTGPTTCALPGSGRRPGLRGSPAPPPCAPVTWEILPMPKIFLMQPSA